MIFLQLLNMLLFTGADGCFGCIVQNAHAETTSSPSPTCSSTSCGASSPGRTSTDPRTTRPGSSSGLPNGTSRPSLPSASRRSSMRSSGTHAAWSLATSQTTMGSGRYSGTWRRGRGSSMMDGLIGCRGSRWRGGGIVKRVRTKKLLLHDCGDDYHGWSSFSRIWNMFLMNLVQTSSSRVVWSITEDGHVQRCLGRLTVEALVTALFFENPCGCSSRCCWHTVIDLFSWNGHAQLHGLSPPLSSLSASFLPLFPSLPQHLELFCIILPTSTQHCIVASSHIASFPVQAILYDYSWYFGVSQHSFTYSLFYNFIPTSIVLRSHSDVSSTFVPCCLNFHSHSCSCSTHPHSSPSFTSI
jgi:hypothetical protein